MSFQRLSNSLTRWKDERLRTCKHDKWWLCRVFGPFTVSPCPTKNCTICFFRLAERKCGRSKKRQMETLSYFAVFDLSSFQPTTRKTIPFVFYLTWAHHHEDSKGRKCDNSFSWGWAEWRKHENTIKSPFVAFACFWYFAVLPCHMKTRREKNRKAGWKGERTKKYEKHDKVTVSYFVWQGENAKVWKDDNTVTLSCFWLFAI